MRMTKTMLSRIELLEEEKPLMKYGERNKEKDMKTKTSRSKLLTSFTMQVVQLMKDRMKNEPVFLALDNVLEHSQEEARRILEAGFAGGSRVLVTSRSKGLLEDLLDKACVSPLPTIDDREALETFKASCGVDLSGISSRSLDPVISLCLFNGSYHPLALKALGGRLKSRGRVSSVSEIEQSLGEVTFRLKGSTIEDMIKSNYDGMKDIAQRMFLDVAVIFRRTRSFIFTHGEEMRYKEMCDWLSILYDCAKDKIIRQVNELAMYGFLQIEGVKGIFPGDPEHFKRRVVVHDLYVDLADGLAAASPRILVGGSKSMEMVRWAELERVVLDSKSEDAAEMLLQDCPKLEVLYASEQTFSKGLQLNGARALLFLKVENCIGEVRGLKDARELAALQIYHDNVKVQLEAQAGFRALREVSSCGELQSLTLHGEACFHGAEDDGGYLSNLTNLRALHLEGWAGLIKLPNLTASVHLELLHIGDITY